MPNADDVRWFKEQFGAEIGTAIQGTPLSLDLLTAIACQETGYIWQVLRKEQLSRAQILELCVGDTLDASGGRGAFPKTRADLVAADNGPQMFEIARKGLESMAQHIASYHGAVSNPEKFCHAFGIFQYDLQFFRDDPDYFLQKHYADFGACLTKCLKELEDALAKLRLTGATSLTDLQMASIAIIYNTGSYKPAKGLKQGYFNGSKYYGEEVFDFLRLSKTVESPAGGPALMSEPLPGASSLPPPTPVTATGAFFEVNIRDQTLRVRREPSVDPDNPRANVIAQLAEGQIVRAVTGEVVNGFLEVETSVTGAHYRGFVSMQYLKPAPEAVAVPIVTPAAVLPDSGIIAVYMPRKDDTITLRTEPASPYSLNELNQPVRKGTTPDELRSELAAIIDWLAVDNPSYERYLPHDRLTFCNIYAHDYSYLAGVYLPRVWWTQSAIESLTSGKQVEPRYGTTIDEQRANDLFRWLRDFGPRFGWRQTGTPTKLQTEVNQGAIGVIVARRREDGLSGHIAVVVPETNDNRARRNTAGEVTAPLSSQAGSKNFRYGGGQAGWWTGEQFAESAMWLHA